MTARTTLIALLLGLVAACGATATVATSAGQTGGTKLAADPRVGVIACEGVRWGKTTVSSSIYLIRTDGKGLRRLTTTPNVEDVTPAWSPDGRRIAFARRDARGWRLYTMGPTGGGARAITGLLSLARAPTWSPDGTQIVFSTAHYDKNKQQTSQCITVMDADGSGRREITNRNPDFWAASPSWQPVR